MSELKPCPFCGDSASLDGPDEDGEPAWGVSCACTAYVGIWGTEAEAIAAWNRRTTTPPTDDEREGLARAIEAAPNDRNAMAIAALAYLAPIRAREIASAEARGVEMERARVVAWLRSLPHYANLANQIERRAHDTGKEG